MSRQAVIHKLKKGGKWRVVDVPEGWQQGDEYPDHASARIHDTEAQAIEDWRERMGVNAGPSSD